LALQAQGLHLAPNASATKLAFLLDLADADRSRSAAGELAFGTVDTWLAWTLSGGAVHVTDPGNAAVTGLLAADGSGWDESVLEALRIPPQVLPAIGDSAGVVAPGTAVEWIRDGLGLVPDSAASEAVAASVADTGGVVFVPALFGLGTPRWDYGARSGFFGMTRGTGRAEMVRAVLEGVAQRGADLL